MHQMTPLSLSKSIEDFERAIEVDEKYSPAYAGLASAYALLAIAPFDFLPPHEAMPKARKPRRVSRLTWTVPLPRLTLRWRW